MAKRTPEEIAAFWFDGVVNTQGRVMNATNDHQLVVGKRSDLSPEYYRYIHDVSSWADRYPHGDPRTWVPLVYAGVKADDFMSEEVMSIDYDQQQIRGLTGRPADGAKPSGTVTPEETTLAAEESDGGSWMDTAMGYAGGFGETVGGLIGGGGESVGIGDIAVVGDAARWAGRGVNDFMSTAAVKGTVRNAFAAANMPAQAVVGSAASIQDDVKNGDWKSAISHAYGANPVFEALFIASENATGTQWYREGGKEQTVWSQTDMGQTILDIAGQGRGEQFGQYDDPIGLQSDQGSGFFINETNQAPSTEESAPSSVGEWQRAARLNANTIVEEEAATPEQIKAIGRIAKATSHEEATKYAESVGLVLNDESEWVQPALGFTFGRYTAGQFSDPRTEAYDNWSGVIDFGTAIFTDPITYVPGGAVKAGVGAVKGGGKLADATKGMVAVSKTGEVIGDAKVVREAVDEIDTFNRLLDDGVILTREGETIGSGSDLKGALRQSFLGQEGDIKRLSDAGVRVADADGLDMGPVSDWATAYAQSATTAEMARGGAFANVKAWDWLSSGRGQAVVRGFAEEQSAYKIIRRSGGKIRPAVAHRLSKATNEDEVRTVLAPILGIDIKRQNELNQFATRLPSHSYDTRLAHPRDLSRLKEAWEQQGLRSIPGLKQILGTEPVKNRGNKLPGMAVMPGHEFDLDIVEDGIEQLTKWATVYDRKIVDDDLFAAAMDRYIATADKGSTRANRAGAFAAVYGRQGDEILLGPEGDVLGTADEVAEMLLNPATRDAVKEGWAKQGATLTRVKEDGVFGMIAARMADEEIGTLGRLTGKKPIQKDIAKQITQAFRKDLDATRWYAQDGTGNNRMLAWSGSSKGEPWLESDVLQRGAMLPDARVMRQEISRLGRIYRWAEDTEGTTAKQTERLLRAGRIADDLSNQAVHYWKGLTLLAGGIRYPAYAMRQTLDTMIAATLAGGPSLIHKPTDLIGLLMTSSVRRAASADTGRDKVTRKLAEIDNPLTALLWRNQLVMDAEGEMFDQGLRAVMDGDASGHDLMYKALNISAGKRGSKGQDDWYANAAPDWTRYDLGDDANAYGYANSLATEMNRLYLSPAARKLADENADMDDIVRWFMYAKGEGRDVVSQFGDDLARRVQTPDGVREYLAEVRQQIRTMTGDDPDMLRMIATGKIDGEPLMVAAKAGGDRKVNPKFIKYVEDARDSVKYGTRQHPLPQTLMGRKESGRKFMDPANQSAWNNWTNMLFRSAGKWEDTFGREPFYKARYEEHVLDNADMMMPDARKAMADDYRKTNPALAKKLDKIKGEGPLDRTDINDLAERRSFNDVRDIAYDAANRREWAFALRLMSPFVQAAVNGMYRWSKAAIENPESSYRFLRAANFLAGPDSAFISDWTNSAGYAGDPFIYEDPETGQRMVSIPLSGAMLDMAGKAFGQEVPQALETGLAMPVAGLNLGFPQAENALLAQDKYGESDLSTITKAMWPGVGPAATIPLDFASDDLGFMEDFLFPYGRPEGSATDRISQLLTPAATRRFANGLFPSEQDKARKARLSVTVFGQILTEEGIDPTDPVAVDAAWERANTITKTWQVIDTFAETGTPSSLSVESIYKDPDMASDFAIGAELLSGIFYDEYLAKNESYDVAQAKFVREYGVGALALLTPSGDNSDVAPPTRAVSTLRRDYREGYNKYGGILTWFNVQGDEFDMDLFAKQVGTGERDVYTIDERRDMILQKFQDTLYFQQTQNIDNASAPDDAKMMAKNELKATLEAKGWRGVLPSSNQSDRNVQIGLLEDVARDPRMRDFVNKRTADTIIRYIKAREVAVSQMQGEGMAGDLATTTSEEWAPLRDALFAWGEQEASKNKDWAYIWRRSPLRAEVEPVETETEEEDY